MRTLNILSAIARFCWLSDKAGDNRMVLVSNSKCWQNEGWHWLQNVFALADESGDSKVVLFSNWLATIASTKSATVGWRWFQNGLQCNGRRCRRQQGDVGFPRTTSRRRTHRSHTGTDPMRPDTIFERFFITSLSQGSLPILNWIWHILVRTIFLLGRGNKEEDNFVKTSLPRSLQLLYLRPTGACTSWDFLDCELGLRNEDCFARKDAIGGKLFLIILLAYYNVPKVFAAVEAFLTANSDCNGTSYSAGQQQPIFRGSVFLSEHKRTPRSPEWCWHQAKTISTCPPPAHTPHSCHHPRRLEVHSPPRLPTTDWRRPSKAVPPAPIVLLHSSARGTSFHPVVLTWLLAQLILRRGDLDAIKDDDQCGDDPLNHHLVINPPRARVISLRVFSSCSSSRRSRRQSLFLNVHLWIPSTGNTL